MAFGMPFLLEQDAIEEAARLCKELGLSFVELNANFPPCQTQRLNAAELRALSERFGIYFTLHIEEECDPFAFHRQVRAAWMDNVRDALRLAREAGMPILNMHLPRGVYITLPTEKVFLYEKYGAEFRAALRAFAEMAVREAGDGVRLCIENTSGWMPHEQAAISELLRYPCFALTFDIGHSHGVGDADEPFLLAHRDRLAHMHGHDALGRRDHLPLGDGEIDLKSRFRLAEQCGARVVLETKTIATLTQSVARLPHYLEKS